MLVSSMRENVSPNLNDNYLSMPCRSNEMSTANKMICPDCGSEMNHHATKVEYGVEETALVDPAFGGVLNEAHTCPECGRTELRAA